MTHGVCCLLFQYIKEINEYVNSEYVVVSCDLQEYFIPIQSN